MALTNAEAREKFLPGMKQAYASALIWRNITNRRYDGDAQNAYALSLNTPTADFTATETDRATTRAPNLPAAETSDEDQQTLNMQWIAQHVAYERNLDLLEGPDGIMPTVLREQAYEMAKKADQRIRSIVTAGITNAKDADNTAGLRLGGAQSRIDENGEPQGTTAAATTLALLPNLIRKIGHDYRAANFWKLGAPNFDEARPVIITDNAMATAMGNYIDTVKPSDTLVDRFIRSDGVEVGGAFGVWKDIPIFVTNDLPLEDMGGKDHHQVIVANAAATTAAFRDPEMAFSQGDIMVNIGGTITNLFGWKAAGEAVYGAKVVNAELLYRYGIREEA